MLAARAQKLKEMKNIDDRGRAITQARSVKKGNYFVIMKGR